MKAFLFRAAKPELLDDPKSRAKMLAFIPVAYEFMRFRSSLHLEGYFILLSDHDVRQFKDETNAVIYIGLTDFREVMNYKRGLTKESKVHMSPGDMIVVKKGDYKGLYGVVEDQLGDRIAVRPYLPRGYAGSLVFFRQKELKRVKKIPVLPEIFEFFAPGHEEDQKEMTAMNFRNVVVIVDASYILYRSHYAMKHLVFEDYYTGGLFGFFRTLTSVLEAYTPKKVLVAFEGGLEAKREFYPEYKGTRGPSEIKERVHRDVEFLKQYLHHMGITHAYAELSEADDVIAHWVREVKDCGVFILSNDTDLLQLVSDTVYVWDTASNIKGRGFVRREFGIDPPQLPLFRSIRGDKSDNLKGIPHFSSEKLRLLSQNCSCPKEIYDSLQIWRKKFLLSDLLLSKLHTYREVVDRNFTLMKLDHLWGDLHVVEGRWDFEKFVEFCDKFGLDQLKQRADLFQALTKKRGIMAL